MTQKKVFVFGIDGAPPELIFDKWKEDLPNLSKLASEGSYARLNSTIPPSTIMAWNSMLSGKDPSELGIFSYTYKDENGKSQIMHSKKIKQKLIWDILGEKKKSIALYVPLSYPVKPINGRMVSGFLTPNLNGACCYPESLKEKIKSMEQPDLFFDVAVGLGGHKGLPISELIEKVYKMTDMQIELLKDQLVNEEWDFFMSVMIGSDRLQHMIWHHFDKTHRKFVPNSEYQNALKDYYIYLDKKLGELLGLLDENTSVIVTSDHGMVKQEGKININNWLIKEGYLVLKEGIDLSEKTRFKNEFVDMEKSIAWGGGAYNARVYINKDKVKDYQKIRAEISEKLVQIKDDNGNPLDTKVYNKEDIYEDTSNPECPDLTVYFDDLRWASNPDLGQEGLYSWETAVGADSAGHSRQGSFIIKDKDIEKGNLGEIDIAQICPTILDILDVEIPKDIKPKSLVQKKDFHEAGLMDSHTGMQFKVYASSHPEGFVIGKPKYIPTDLLEFVGMKKRYMFSKSVNRFNLFKKKEIVEENLKILKSKYPECIYHCDKHKNWFLGLPEEKIKKSYDCRDGLKQLMSIPTGDLDDYLKSVKDFINMILQTGVSLNDIGISHSTLLGNYTPGKSDIDIIVYGKEKGWEVINFLETVKHPSLKWKSAEDWAKYYRERVVSTLYNEQEYVLNMVRKKDDGFFNGHVFSVFVVEKPEEFWYDWEANHEPLGTVKIRGTIQDHYNSIVRPGFYEIENSKIIEGHEEVPIKRIVTWSRPFVLQAKKGENIEACGLLEKVTSKEGDFYQLVLGYFDTYTNDRGEKEYLKALV